MPALSVSHPMRWHEPIDLEWGVGPSGLGQGGSVPRASSQHTAQGSKAAAAQGSTAAGAAAAPPSPPPPGGCQPGTGWRCRSRPGGRSARRTPGWR